MTSFDPQFGGVGELPDPAGGDLPASTAARHEAGAATAPLPPARARSRRARRRERRQQQARERYGFRDLVEDVLDLALDVLFFWR
jgi:hypothetical protein